MTAGLGGATWRHYVGPFQANGKPYPQVQYETDIGASENLCTPGTGAGGTAPPIGSYGAPDLARFGGTLTSAVLPNPQFTGKCRR